ncbi:MAG: SpoIIE family protein phosphatase, partial [Janthinobacterium lividum]
ETAAGRLAIVVTEAATNILKHAGEGKILLRTLWSQAGLDGKPLQNWPQGAVPGIEVLAIDSGEGIGDIALKMVDGTSSAGSYGVGLGAMQRQSNEFDLYSQPGDGCLVWMVLWANVDFTDNGCWQIGAVSLPLAGETACGDSWEVAPDGEALLVMVADGLGHGPQAALASLAAVDVVWNNHRLAPGAAIEQAHGALRHTRGAAVGVARINVEAGSLNFCGVGNIAGSVEFAGNDHDGSSRSARAHLVSHNGIVGNAMRRAQEFASPWRTNALLVMHSDGINTRWDLSRYPGLTSCHPALVAAMLYRDFSRERDDVTVLAVRHRDVSQPAARSPALATHANPAQEMLP